MKYYAQKDGEWVEPEQENHHLGCCDCGLVHVLDFRIRNGNVQFRARRDNRKTAAKRREMKKRG